jgi:tetratricopeptide (TPR) repeat protein
VLLEEKGELDEAEAAYRRADERGHATGAFNLGVLLEERGALPEARDAYRRADHHDDCEVSRLARAALADVTAAMAQSGTVSTVGSRDGA